MENEEKEERPDAPDAFNIGISIGPVLHENMIKTMAKFSVQTNRVWSKSEFIRYAIKLATAAEGFDANSDD